MRNSSFEFKIDTTAHCFFVKHQGVLDKEIIIEGNAALAKHADYDGSMNRLINVSDCHIDLTVSHVRELSALVERRSDFKTSFKGAYVVSDKLGFGLARVFDAITTIPNGQYRVFNRAHETLNQDLKDWLDLEQGFDFPEFLNI